MQNFEQIRGHVQSHFRITTNDAYVLCVELEDDDGRRLLRASTIIAPITGIDARRMLAYNWHSRVGWLAIGELDGVPYLQLCENRPSAGLDGAELDRLVLEIGGQGDRMERLLSAGGDLL